MLACPDLTRNQVFCELDRLSRDGQVRLTVNEPGLYGVRSTTACEPSVTMWTGIHQGVGLERRPSHEDHTAYILVDSGTGLLPVGHIDQWIALAGHPARCPKLSHVPCLEMPLSHAFERTVASYLPMMAGSCVASSGERS